MNKIVNEKFNEILFEETLPNGLQVTLIYKPAFVSSSALFAVPYGSLDFQQQDGDKIVSVPCGAAHFLEHKMFEDSNKDVMTAFSAMGANVNAFTSYNETVYYFNTGNKDISEPLSLLLDFVQQLNIDEESVEKEKGIITQELLMYKQMPDHRLMMEALKSLYHEFPLKYDIVGSEESISDITLANLTDSYLRNYAPKNMRLVIVTGEDPEKIFDVVRDNQARKEFSEYRFLKRIKYEEPISCVNDHKIISMEVNKTKVCIAYKLKVIEENSVERSKAEWALRFLLEAYFTGLNPEYQDWLDSGVITDYFGYDVDLAKDYALLMFYNETDDVPTFKKIVEQQMQVIKTNLISEKLLKQLKRRYYGRAVRMFNNINEIGITYVRSMFDDLDIFKSIELINEIDFSIIKETLPRLELDNHSLIEIRNTEV